MFSSQKNVSQLQIFLTVTKCVTVKETGHSQENVSQLENCVNANVRKWATGKFVAVIKLCNSWKIGSQLDKWVTVEKNA